MKGESIAIYAGKRKPCQISKEEKVDPADEDNQNKKPKTFQIVGKERTYENVFLKTGLYEELKKADELHSRFCSCVLHYSVWYKYFNKNWKNKVATSAFSKNWCKDCQNYIDASTAWNKTVKSHSPKQQQSETFKKAEANWKQKEAQWLKHIEHAQVERKSHECLRELAKVGKIRLICFDFKTTLVLPYWGYRCSPRAVYYMSRMNVYLFGVVDETANGFTGYIYPENLVDSLNKPTKKGSSHVIAMMYLHLLQSGLTEIERTQDRDLYFTADNCSGQNKNQYMLQFLCMAIEVGWADNVYLSFMVPGHTKFSPDRWFGLIGKHILNLDAWNIKDLVNNVSAALKHQQIVKDITNEDCINFKPFLKQHYKKPDFAVSEEYHFWFSKDHKGCVRVKSNDNQQWSEPHKLRKTVGNVNLDITALPKFNLIPLSKDRIKTMRECKQLIDSPATLDYEDQWDIWDPPLFEIQQIVESRIRNGVTEYKVKFKDLPTQKLSQDKHDEWIAATDLVSSKRMLSSWKGEVKACNKILKIHEFKDGKLHVQWDGWPKKQDWTWETESAVKQLDKKLYSMFVTPK